jgi:hypothetical protein
MAKKENASPKKDISLGDISGLASNSVTMVPADVKFDAAGQVLVTNPTVNEFIKENLVQPGAITLTPGSGSEEKLVDINIFCDIHINLRRGCSANDK